MGVPRTASRCLLLLTAVFTVARAIAAQPARAPYSSAAAPSATDDARTRASATVIAQAGRLTASGDTAGATRMLRNALNRDSRNGPLWYAYGLLMYERSRAAWRVGIMPSGLPSIVIAADSALGLATLFSPDSVQYVITYAKLLWGVRYYGGSTALRLQRDALERLKGSDDAAITSEVADQLGLMLWRNFEPKIGLILRSGLQRLPASVADSNVDNQSNNYTDAATLYGPLFFDPPLEYARRARELNPDAELYFRHEMMMLAALQRWSEMDVIAHKRIAERPRQPWPWLSLGLSQHRRGQTALAQASFDSGYARLPDADRVRLSAIKRLMKSNQLRAYDTLSLETREQLDEFYWNTGNPSYLLPGNPMQAEFRARMVYAELRFTEDERRRPGTTTDRGEIYIRYGPPDVEFGVKAWVYRRERMNFTFEHKLSTGSIYLTEAGKIEFESVLRKLPSSWSTVAVLRNRIDSVSAQVARFRAIDDSMDVAVFTAIRPGVLRRRAPIDTSIIRRGIFFVDALGREITRVTDTVTTGERDSTQLVGQNYFVRTTSAARGLRVEALEPDLMQAARTIAELPAFATRGFGASDLLIASTVRPRAGTAGARWTDFSIDALVGSTVPRGAPIGLLWESYDARSADGTARLRFAIRVERETDAGFVATAARIVGGIRDALMRGAADEDGLTISYVREVAAAPVIADYLRLDVGVLEPGRYRVSLQVTDLVGGGVVRRVQRFVVAER